MSWRVCCVCVVFFSLSLSSLLSSWVCCACVCVHGVVIFSTDRVTTFFWVLNRRRRNANLKHFLGSQNGSGSAARRQRPPTFWVSRNCLIIVTCCLYNRGGEISMRSSDWNHWLRKQLIIRYTNAVGLVLFGFRTGIILVWRAPAWKSWPEVSAQMNIAGCRWWPGWFFFTCWSSSSHAWASCRLRLPKPR